MSHHRWRDFRHRSAPRSAAGIRARREQRRDLRQHKDGRAMNIRKTRALALASVILVAGTTVGLGRNDIPAAQADPSFCGVTVAGPTYVGPPTAALWAYTIRNKCRTTYEFRLYLRSVGRYTECKTVEPHAYRTYTIGAHAPNWEARVC